MLDGDFQDRAQSLRRLILDQREAAVPDRTAQIVIDQHRGFWGYQHDLIGMLLANEIDRAQYLERFNDGLSALMTADREVLGDQAYSAIFGPEFDATDSVIDAETFLAEEPSDELEVDEQAGPSPW